MHTLGACTVSPRPLFSLPPLHPLARPAHCLDGYELAPAARVQGFQAHRTMLGCCSGRLPHHPSLPLKLGPGVSDSANPNPMEEHMATLL